MKLGLIAVGLVAAAFVSGLAVPAAVAHARCTDCDLVIAEHDLPDGYAYDADSPQRDSKGEARSLELDECVLAKKLRRERRGVEGQSAIFVAGDDPIAGDESVIRFATVERARAFAAAFDNILFEGPKCDVIRTPGGDGSLHDVGAVEAVNLGEIGDQGAAIAWVGSPLKAPDQFLAIVRTGRKVLVVEAYESRQIDRARFVELVEDAVAAARG